ncbi:MAG: hypothetical protein ACJ75B_21115 [Flavisolibacter sp.]
MKKLIAVLIAVVVCSPWLLAQTSETSVSLNKINQPAIKIDLDGDDDLCQDFFVSNLKNAGYSEKGIFSKSNKVDEGFYAIKGFRFDGTKDPVDLYVKLEQTGKKSNRGCTIYMLVSKEGGFITSSSDRATYAAAEKFLNAFVDQIAAYKLKQEIVDQEDVVHDAQKKYEKLQDKQKDMEHKVENLQKDLKENAEDQKKQSQSVDDEKSKLEQLKSQYKKYA